MLSSWPSRGAVTGITQAGGYNNPSEGLHSSCFRNLHFTSKPYTGVHLTLTVSTLTFCSRKSISPGNTNPLHEWVLYTCNTGQISVSSLRTDDILLWLQAKNEREKKKEKVTRSHNNFPLNCEGCSFTFAKRLHFCYPTVTTLCSACITPGF